MPEIVGHLPRAGKQVPMLGEPDSAHRGALVEPLDDVAHRCADAGASGGVPHGEKIPRQSRRTVSVGRR
ncbi:hypothetical protein PA7_35990 [Pseudonocardia asaccharolytica DSM 44247 = NBRC 16224]|uniref:Uncharacterized protein n=1 Tax=Pseudonocardia asaccharolytica DSM 44247 = NBRC 16224 TaxID=1123024 RepID=A0A511D4P9_9PSEU|nr:hypothetical protein PA7_35990 [Pseudonocardia asaccharolytica DSM 44247 = NBRC 16224]